MELAKILGTVALLTGVAACATPLNSRGRALDNNYFTRMAETRTCWANSPCETDLYDANGDGVPDSAITIGDFDLDGTQDYQFMRWDTQGRRTMWIKDESTDGNFEMLQIQPPPGTQKVTVDYRVEQ